MKTILPKNIKDLNHAYCLISRDDCAADELINIMDRTYGFKSRNNPDFLHIKKDVFSVSDARDVVLYAQSKPFSGRKLIFVEARKLTAESQNALLKAVEEPALNTHYFIIIPRLILLPTLESRLVIIRQSISKDNTILNTAENFVQDSKKNRLRTIKALVDIDEKKEIEKFLDELEMYLHNVNYDPVIQKELLKMKKYFHGRSSNAKHILEHLALIL